jgi:hypothetical protein
MEVRPHGEGRSGDHLDLGLQARGTGKTGVERQQRQVQALGESDVEPVVEADVLPQAPRPTERSHHLVRRFRD